MSVVFSGMPIIKETNNFKKKNRCCGCFDISNKYPFEFSSSTGQRFLFVSVCLWEKKHHGQYGNNGFKDSI